MRRRGAVRLLGAGVVAGAGGVLAWPSNASPPTRKAPHKIGLALSIPGLGQTKPLSATGPQEIERDIAKAKRGERLRKRRGKIRAKGKELTVRRIAREDTFRDAFLAWLRRSKGAQPETKIVTLVLQHSQTGANGTPNTALKTYKLYGCWPKSWKLASLDGKGNDVLTEEVVVVIEWFEEA